MMTKRLRLIDNYVAKVEARYGGFKSNRTLVAELAKKEEEQEQLLYKEVFRIISVLHGRWDQKKHAALGKDEHKDIRCEPQLIIYPDGSKKYSCAINIVHIDMSLLEFDVLWELSLQEKKQAFTALSLKNFKHVLESTYDFLLPYAKEGYRPLIYSVRTVTPEIHFPGYCPSFLPTYAIPLKKSYHEPSIVTFDSAFVHEHLHHVQPFCLVPEEPDYTLPTYYLDNNTKLYNLASACSAFQPLIGPKEAKAIEKGMAIRDYSLYALAWQGITPFARELTKWHTQETYYLETV